MPAASEITPGPEEIARRIFTLRGQRVLLDADLARIYGVPTKRLNEQVKRNRRRFPEDFVFQLTPEEAMTVVRSRSQNATLKKGQNVKHSPYAFTEHGAIQAANVLNSDAAIEMGVHVVRAFVRLREWLGTQRALAAKLEELESRVSGHDDQLAAVIEALRQLTAYPEPGHDRKMGFHRGNRWMQPALPPSNSDPPLFPVPVIFDTFFQIATGNRPHPYQRRSAGDTTGRPCESRLINIPTGLGKTAAQSLSNAAARLYQDL